MRVRYWVTNSREVMRFCSSADSIAGMPASTTVKGRLESPGSDAGRLVCPYKAARIIAAEMANQEALRRIRSLFYYFAPVMRLRSGSVIEMDPVETGHHVGWNLQRRGCEILA